ncbi:hypothetical protein CBR_g9103 [Chara braunii]|uniref:DUF659 domain-containing protein n=1 Tax=Chara braunii TaxID=69332 RepID=A0A388KNQ0_CHABU|nr:hypothetical protein CBR_g9103 [Chara braunii]|eukprot:GBG71690.1 hypothetical protein CBR_g9103 [Chara braunii]
MSRPGSRGRFTSLPDGEVPFQEADESRQRWLQGKHAVWEWVRQGQEVGVQGKGQYKLRCTLCNHIRVGAQTKAEDHFTRPAAHCRFRTGEILYKLMRDGVSITDPVGRAMAERHMDVREEELEMEDLRRADDAATPAARMADDRAADHGDESGGRGADPPMTDEGRVGGVRAEDELTALRERIRVLEVGRQPTRSDGTLQQCSGRVVDMAWLRTKGTSGPSGVVVPHDRRMLQTRLDSWASGGLRQQYERLWARALFRAGVPFSFMRLETTQELHDFMVSLMRVTIGPTLVLPSYTDVRTRLLDEIYHEIAERVAPKKAKWKLTGCTMMTDGATTRSYKLVVNFIAAGKDGPILLTTVDMSERDKTGVALADLWEDVIRDIGVDVVNAYCTDNAYANKAKMVDGRQGEGGRGEDAPRVLVVSAWCGDFPRLREVAIKVLAMWSTASPCERNWASHDFIHSKRRNKLSSDSLRKKLVFIHWNMQLLRAQSGPRRGFVDVWEDMVEDPPEPQVCAASEEVYDDSMTIPEEVEAEIRSRRKEGGDRASARLLQGRDYEDEDEEDVIYEANDVWEGKDMIEEIAAAEKGKDVVRAEHCDAPFPGRVAQQPCPAVEEQGSAPVPEEQGSAPVTEERVTHATVLEELHPVVEDQVTGPTAEELETATVISGQQTRLDGRARETEGVPTSLSSPTRHNLSACTGTDDTTLAPFHSEVPLTIGEAVAGHHTGHPCVMETATHTGIVQQEGAVTDEGGHETDIEPPSMAEEVAPTSEEAPRTLESTELHTATTTTTLGGSPGVGMTSAALRPVSFYTAPPLPVLHGRTVVRGPGLTLPPCTSSPTATTPVGQLSSSMSIAAQHSQGSRGVPSVSPVARSHSDPVCSGPVVSVAVPPLPTRVSSAIVDNTSTRGRKRKAPDTRGREQPQRPAVQGRPRGRPPGGRSGRGRGRQGVAGATERLLGSLGAIGGGSPAPISMHGVRTRSRGAADKTRRVEVQEDDDDDEQGSGDGSESEYEAPSHSSDDDDDADTGGDDVDAQ